MPAAQNAPRQPDAVTVRRLWPGDRAAFRDHLLRLDAESRHDRFGGAVSDEFLHRYADACFAPGDVTFGCFHDGVLRGAGELRRVKAGGQTLMQLAEGEFAFSVETAFRRRGIGRDLMSRLLRAAANRGMGKLTLTCLAQNHAMQSLARSFGADLRFEACNVTGRLIARRPTPFSVWGEAFDTAAGIAGGLADLHRHAMTGQAATSLAATSQAAA